MLPIIDRLICNVYCFINHKLQLCCRLRESLQAHHAIKDRKQKQTRCFYTPVALVEASLFRFAMRHTWKHAWKVRPRSRWGYSWEFNALDKHTSTCKNTLTYTLKRHYYFWRTHFTAPPLWSSIKTLTASEPPIYNNCPSYASETLFKWKYISQVRNLAIVMASKSNFLLKFSLAFAHVRLLRIRFIILVLTAFWLISTCSWSHMIHVVMVPQDLVKYMCVWCTHGYLCSH